MNKPNPTESERNAALARQAWDSYWDAEMVRRVERAERRRQILGWLLALAGIALVVAVAVGWVPLE